MQHSNHCVFVHIHVSLSARQGACVLLYCQFMSKVYHGRRYIMVEGISWSKVYHGHIMVEGISWSKVYHGRRYIMVGAIGRSDSSQQNLVRTIYVKFDMKITLCSQIKSYGKLKVLKHCAYPLNRPSSTFLEN